MGINIDLHTHSEFSSDGGLKEHDYITMFEVGDLDCVAITDHNEIDFALAMNQKHGSKFIVGEEIMTTKGEIIGLFLTKKVASKMTPEKTIDAIKKQGGLVYIPHPFETVRSGLDEKQMAKIISKVDIIEINNGRAIFQNESELSKEWAVRYEKAGASSSDAHGKAGWGKTYSKIAKLPNKDNLVSQLHKATFSTKNVGLLGAMYPKINRFRKKF